MKFDSLTVFAALSLMTTACMSGRSVDIPTDIAIQNNAGFIISTIEITAEASEDAGEEHYRDAFGSTRYVGYELELAEEVVAYRPTKIIKKGEYTSQYPRAFETQGPLATRDGRHCGYPGIVCVIVESTSNESANTRTLQSQGTGLLVDFTFEDFQFLLKKGTPVNGTLRYFTRRHDQPKVYSICDLGAASDGDSCSQSAMDDLERILHSLHPGTADYQHVEKLLQVIQKIHRGILSKEVIVKRSSRSTDELPVLVMEFKDDSKTRTKAQPWARP